MISEAKRNQFLSLYGEFVREYLSQGEGQEHLRRYDEVRTQGRKNFEEVKVEASRSGAVPTEKVLQTLLPHSDSVAHRNSGAWVHIAPAIQGEIQNWFEATGWTQAEDWPKVATAVLSFLLRCAETPSEIDSACREFVSQPYTTGLQTGMLTPMLNALRPDEFLIINNKSRRIINYFVGSSFRQQLTDYPAANAAGRGLIAELQDRMRDLSQSDARPADLFDMFCHWLVTEKHFEPIDTRVEEGNAVPRERVGDMGPRDSGKAPQRIWLYAPGSRATYWNEFRGAGIAAIGWDQVGDLKSLRDPDAIKARMDEVYPEPESVVNANQCFDFAHRMRPGDWIYAKKGRREIVGFGVIKSEYRFDPEREYFQNVREVHWQKSGSWPVAEGRMLSMKTVTEITDDTTLVEELEQLIGLTERMEPLQQATAYSVRDLSAETAIPEETIRLWENRLKRKRHVIFQGPPGTGKTFVAELLARLLIGNTFGFSETIQFHPSYSYEDFMQGIRPVILENQLTFKRVDGRFLQFCDKARQRGSSPCVLIIDEINRGNLSRIFGELMYLLEYRDKSIPLAGEGDGRTFNIPKNVFVIGTMNTADRSIALVDHALRRRFTFIYLGPDYDVLRKQLARSELVADPLIDALRAVNASIDDRNYEVGISFFLKDSPYLRSTLRDIWQGEIEPYLEEYFYDQPGKTEPLRWKTVAGGRLAAWAEH